MKHENFKRQIFAALFSIIFGAVSIAAQTNEITYQGKLTDTGTPSATYDFEFRLCAAANECAMPLQTKQRLAVSVSGGVFTVKLDFNQAHFDGSNRWLEIAVKRPAEGSYTTLSPRERVTSAPYAIRSLNAGIADNAMLFGGLTTEGFVQNTTTQQPGNFNLSGNGILGGTFAADNVGIGVTTPQAGIKLDVNGNVLIRTPGLGGNIQFGTPSGQTGMTIIKTNRADIRFDDSTLKLLAGAGTGAMADTNGIAVNTLGNVGIGILTPSTKLDVAGSAFIRSSLDVGNSLGVSGALSVGNGAIVSNGLTVNTGNLTAPNATLGGLTVTGDVSVGNKITTNSLRVSSGGFSFATVAGNYQQDICRDVIAGTLGQCGSSSLRYKSDVKTLSGGLSLVNRLRPVAFNWKYNGQRDLGFIAEEVFQIEPLLTTRNDAGETEGVKYKLISVVLVNAVKEQQTQIERQQRQIDALTRLVCSQNPQAEICRGAVK